MKKILFLLSCFPLLVFAQNQNGKILLESVETKTDPQLHIVNKDNYNGPAGSQFKKEKPQKHYTREQLTNKLKRPSFFDAFVIGITRYDLQTNASTGRRVKVHSNGGISAVWTHSMDQQDNFPNRGTGYNYFDGNNWIKDPDSIERIESTRTGWPTINVDPRGNKSVFTITHIASVSGNSGGYVYSKNDQLGSTTWQSESRDVNQGPIWYRTAQSGGYTHMIGNYSTQEGDTTIKQGIRAPMVYFRSSNYGDSFQIQEEILPGYADRSRRFQGSADNYSISARDSIVAVVLAHDFRVRDVIMWKSTDYGDTWEKHTIFKYPNNLQEYRNDVPYNDTIYWNDGTVSTVIDEEGTVHVTYGIQFLAGSSSSSLGYTIYPYSNGIHYWNDQHTTNKVFDHVDTSYNSTTRYNFTVEGQTMDTFRYNTDTTYEYTYQGGRDSSAMSSMTLYKFNNYTDSSLSSLVPTDTMEVWPEAYEYQYNSSGNVVDSTLVSSDTLYLDSADFPIQVIDSVYNTVKNYTTSITEAGYMPFDSADLQNGTFSNKIFVPQTGGGFNYFYNVGISTMPSLVRGGKDTLFVIYSSYNYGAYYGNEQPNYRDIFITYSTDNGQTWSAPQNITQTGQNPRSESVYPSANRTVVNGNIHFLWQEDFEQGAAYGEASEQGFITENSIYYGVLDVQSVINNDVQSNVGLKEKVEISKLNVEPYPNPFTNKLKVSIDLDKSSDVSVKLFDVTGKVRTRKDLGTIAKGESDFQLNTSSLSKGIYFLEVQAGDKRSSYKVVKN